MTASSKSKIVVCLLILPLAVLAIVIGWPIIKVFMESDYLRARFISPSNSANEVWFYGGGFLDRDMLLYVKPQQQKLQSVANLDWFPNCEFSSAQWSKDGQVIVCSVKAKAVGDKPVEVVAFDFSKNKPMNPLWMTVSGFDNKPESEWRNQELLIKETVAAHGGLSGRQIDDTMLKESEKKFWAWQFPRP